MRKHNIETWTNVVKKSVGKDLCNLRKLRKVVVIYKTNTIDLSISWFRVVLAGFGSFWLVPGFSKHGVVVLNSVNSSTVLSKKIIGGI